MPTVDWRSESAQEQLRIATVEWLWDGLIRGQVVERGYLIFGEGLADDFREAVDARQSTVDEVASLILGLGDAELAEVGLAGTELRLKLGGFRRAMDRAESEASVSSPTTRRLRLPKAIRRALTWADVYLDSLIKLVPKGEAIKELKDAAGAATDDLIDAEGAP